MATLEEAFEYAVQCHRAGDVARAEGLYRQIIDAFPDLAPAHRNLAQTLVSQGKLADAISRYQQALRLDAGDFRTHFSLGIALQNAGRHEEAIASYRQALALAPGYAGAHNNLGAALRTQGHLEEALKHFRLAIQLAPNDPDPHNNLGLTLADLERWDEAVASYQRALAVARDPAGVHRSLGVALVELGQLEEAIAHHREALRLDPANPEMINALAAALAAHGQTAEAIACCRQALRLRPDFVDAHVNLAAAFLDQLEPEAALASLEEALRILPDDFNAHHNRSLAWLLGGDYERGWPEYDWRWRSPRHQRFLPAFSQPRWDGSPLEGRTILLQTEQGFGDTLHFIRYAPLVKERGGRVVVHCPRRLLPLLATCPGIDQLVAHGDRLPDFHVYAALMSLPGNLGTRLDTVPARVPYLFADPQLSAQWERELKGFAGFKIGINWQGNPQHDLETVRRRAIPLTQFAPLAQVPGVQLFGLLKGAGSEQLVEVASRFSVIDLGPRLDGVAGAFMDTAAVMKHLDLVISTDTAVTHLAGALGAPVWLALNYAAEWRWLLHREDSPWYPSMRLFRQPRPGDWEGVLQRMTSEVRRLLERQSLGKG
jgi:tetratricopeptide (TPR) repeat protein